LSKENINNTQKFRGDAIRDAFDTFEILGIALKQAIIEYIERKGVNLDAYHYYSLVEIERYLCLVFGEDATALMIQRLKKVLYSESVGRL
jgi:hypothetical protein